MRFIRFIVLALVTSSLGYSMNPSANPSAAQSVQTAPLALLHVLSQNPAAVQSIAPLSNNVQSGSMPVVYIVPGKGPWVFMPVHLLQTNLSFPVPAPSPLLQSASPAAAQPFADDRHEQKAELADGKSLQASDALRLPSSSRLEDISHQTMVKKARKFACKWPKCGESFGTKFGWQRHQKKHTGERPFACTHEGCTRRFAENSSLTRHKLCHMGESSYVCHGCHEGCADRTSLNKHKKVCTGFVRSGVAQSSS